MGIYSEYLDKNMNFPDLNVERKRQLKRIGELRGNRCVLAYVSDLTRGGINNNIEYADLLPFIDQLSNLKGSDAIDIVIETPGGQAEIVEQIVKAIREKFLHVGIIIPGTAKSAGTIFAMAGDEILMGSNSALGPIDAQMIYPGTGKRFSADALLDGLEKIKEEVIASGGKLNPAYIPILQNISPGEIQHCENAQAFSRMLVTDWLRNYKFSHWDKHIS
jgi:ClpP class serine protease